jgi:drug/metabolite transporter (DMT)-like permease
VLALLLGNLLNREIIGLRLWLGASLIMVGVAVHQWDELRPTVRAFRTAFR